MELGAREPLQGLAQCVFGLCLVIVLLSVGCGRPMVALALGALPLLAPFVLFPCSDRGVETPCACLAYVVGAIPWLYLGLCFDFASVRSVGRSLEISRVLQPVPVRTCFCYHVLSCLPHCNCRAMCLIYFFGLSSVLEWAVCSGALWRGPLVSSVGSSCAFAVSEDTLHFPRRRPVLGSDFRA